MSILELTVEMDAQICALVTRPCGSLLCRGVWVLQC